MSSLTGKVELVIGDLERLRRDIMGELKQAGESDIDTVELVTKLAEWAAKIESILYDIRG